MQGLPMVMRSVYAPYYPEVREVVDALWAERPHHLYTDPFTGRQDTMHQPLLDAWRAFSPVELREEFPYEYATAGASVPIFHVICGLRHTLHVFDGEYEGYESVANDLGIPVRHHARNLNSVSEFYEHGDIFWVSMPSALDGEYWNEFTVWLSQMQLHHPDVKIYVDATYVGAVRSSQPFFAYEYPNVEAVVFSLSKPFGGTFYHRIGGAFSRSPIKTLMPVTKWFKDVSALVLGARLLERYRVNEIPKRYTLLQQDAIKIAKDAGQLPSDAVASNVVILARSSEGPEEFRRADGYYRYCLTPIMTKLMEGNGR